MNKHVVFRRAFTLVSAGLIMFALAANLLVNAQGKPCQEESKGWTNIDGTQIDLTGTWTIVKSTNCKNS